MDAVADQQEQAAGQTCLEDRPGATHALRLSRTEAILAAILAIIPIMLFYAILFRQSTDLPLDDDYDALLGFLNQLVQLKSTSAKFLLFLSSQHNEYKLFFEHGLAWLQFALLGHIDLGFLCALGNGFVLLLAILLWKMFLPACKDTAARVAFFIPVPWLLFQLHYFETVDWAMAGVANISVLVFALAAIHYLVKGTRGAFWVAIACTVLAVGSSGNGFVVIPIGLLILAIDRRYARIAPWLVASGICFAAYFYRYNAMSSQSSVHESVFATLLRPQPLFVVAFIGNAAGFSMGKGCLVLGFALCLLFAAMVRRGTIRKNPQVSYCVLFLLLTAIGVAGLRSGLGLAQSLAPRYTIYSVLLVIFAWFMLVEEYLQHVRRPRMVRGIVLGAMVVSILFCLDGDSIGMRQIENRRQEQVRAMRAFEHRASTDNLPDLVYLALQQDSGAVAAARRTAANRQAQAILTESIKLGVYRPPPE